MKENFKKRLIQAMSKKNINQAELSTLSTIRASSISDYINGKYSPKQDKVDLLAKALNVNPAWLLGYDVPMENKIKENNKQGESSSIDYERYDNIMPITTKKLPLLGEIACGEPIYANEDRESYVEVGTDIKADVCLKAKGDSMINARIHDGDIVFIREQPVVENGEIAAVIIGNEATLKRVEYLKDQNKC